MKITFKVRSSLPYPPHPADTLPRISSRTSSSSRPSHRKRCVELPSSTFYPSPVLTLIRSASSRPRSRPTRLGRSLPRSSSTPVCFLPPISSPLHILTLIQARSSRTTRPSSPTTSRRRASSCAWSLGLVVQIALLFAPPNTQSSQKPKQHLQVEPPPRHRPPPPLNHLLPRLPRLPHLKLLKMSPRLPLPPQLQTAASTILRP